MVCPQKNNIYIDSLLDVALDSHEIVELALHAERDGFDAVCLYCFSDPAIEACRECLKIPVVGAGQASVLVAACLGNTFSILTTSERRISEKTEFVRKVGVDFTRLASVRSVEFSSGEGAADEGELIAALTEESRRCVLEDRADVIILGCLSFVGLAEKVAAGLGIPVVDPGFTLISMAELMVSQGLTHSKASYPFPPERERHWSGGSIQI